MFTVYCLMFNALSPSLIPQKPQQCRGFTLFFSRLHLRVTRLSVNCFHWHDAQHTLIRSPYGFLTYSKDFPEPFREFLRLVLRISPRRPKNFSAPSAIGFALALFSFLFIPLPCLNCLT